MAQILSENSIPHCGPHIPAFYCVVCGSSLMTFFFSSLSSFGAMTTWQ
jgi:hypothetical protein